jgi:hypothetical protein
MPYINLKASFEAMIESPSKGAPSSKWLIEAVSKKRVANFAIARVGILLSYLQKHLSPAFSSGNISL